MFLIILGTLSITIIAALFSVIAIKIDNECNECEKYWREKEINDIELAKLNEICDKATPGPWLDNTYSRIVTCCDKSSDMLEKYDEAENMLYKEFGGRGYKFNPNETGADRKTPSERQKRYWELCNILDENNTDVAYFPCRCGDTATLRGYADMHFICSARTAMPALIAEVRRLRELLGNSDLGKARNDNS